MPNVIKLSVRDLTDFICRTGSVDSRSGISRMLEGTRLHGIIQSRQGKDYRREVSLAQTFRLDELIFELSGRADGILDEGDAFTIDEIKTTAQNLRYIREEDYPAYRAQAECYACMFALENKLDFVRTRLTFCNIETEECIFFYRDHTIEELLERVKSLLSEYKKWTLLRLDAERELRESAEKLKFPFREYRDGQSELVLAAFRAFRRHERLIAQAPTGIGKTMSVLYPAYKALGSGFGRRIFYLTSKTTLREAAENAVDLLRRHGLRTRGIVITAKEKICLCRDAVRDCSSIVCPYSSGHYDRVNDALYALLSGYESYNLTLIQEIAREYEVCPFELSLDAALFCDLIICDYNYLFDPNASLKRFFGDYYDGDGCIPDENILLIDEAHNLGERARDMFSSELVLEPFLRLLRTIPESDMLLYLPLRLLCREFLRLKRHCGEDNGGVFMSHKPFERFGELLDDFANAALEWQRANGFASSADETELDETGKPANQNAILPHRAVADLRGLAREYLTSLKLARLCADKFVNYVTVNEGGEDIRVKLYCLDPSELISKRLLRGRGAVLFSATLTPIEYFADLLDYGDAGRVTLELESPFERKNLFVAAMDKISTCYSDRANTIFQAAEVIAVTASAREGNYMAYFPSYRLMREVFREFVKLGTGFRCLMQKPDMSEPERESFLRQFAADGDGTLIGFAVLGGIFAEGIDLVGERLIGSIIIGVGLAKPNSESNLIAEYYGEAGMNGYNYAYLYPGINKVMQAAGRVIRTETDRGVVILVDDRYATPDYIRVLPKHWRGMNLIGDTKSLQSALKKFWAAGKPPRA